MLDHNASTFYIFLNLKFNYLLKMIKASWQTLVTTIQESNNRNMKWVFCQQILI